MQARVLGYNRALQKDWRKGTKYTFQRNAWDLLG